MGRTVINKVDYFPHFAKTGKTIFILKSQFGNNGYAFWFQLLETLCQQENHFYDCREETNWQYLISIIGVNAITGTEILDLLAKLGNIDPEMWKHKIIWCQNLVNNLSDVYQKRKRPLPIKPLIDTINPLSVPEKTISVTEIPHSIVKKSRVDKSRVDINSVFEFWNSQKLIKHQKLTEDTRRQIAQSLRDNTQAEVSQAISNYAEIVNAEQYYFKYTWTLKDFLKRGLEKFLDGDIARQNYLIKKNNGGNGQNASGNKNSPRDVRTQGYSDEDYLRSLK
jgi:hypothetical protein